MNPTEQEVQSVSVGWLDRLTLIVMHYFFGPLLGLGLRIFVPDRKHRSHEQFAAMLMLFAFTAFFLASQGHVQPVFSFGLALLLLCPQWLYAFTKVQHTIFEYRGYMFAVGMAALLASSVDSTGTAGLVIGSLLVLGLAYKTRQRLPIYSDPLLFWKQAHLDTRGDNLIASAYLYQLQKRERFGEIDDLYRWMTDARIPDCRAFLLNLAAARFGSKTDNAVLDVSKLKDACKILEETARRWPTHADVWRNLGTVQYYLSAMGAGGGEDEAGCLFDYSMTRPLKSFNKALSILPLDSLTHLSMGHCFMYEGKWPDAVASLTMAYNYLPAGAYLVEDISLIRIKLMDALDMAANTCTNEEKAMAYRREFNRHQDAFEKYNAYYVTEENARFIV